jgi:hypothetical protein
MHILQHTSTALYLVLVNLIPLFGVLFFDWSVYSILIIYWLESAVIGFWNIMKMRKSEARSKPGEIISTRLNGKPITQMAKPAIIFFFIIHYGIFMTVHGAFVLLFFGLQTGFDADPLGIVLAAVSLFVSHGLSYKQNFIGKGEYKKKSVDRLMMEPYGRILIMHFVIIGGAFLIASFNGPEILVVLLVVLKIILDLAGHAWEHRSGS